MLSRLKNALIQVAAALPVLAAISGAAAVTRAPAQGLRETLGAARDYAVLGLRDGEVTVDSASGVTGDFGYSSGVTSTRNEKIGEISRGLWTGTAFVHSAVADFRYNSSNYLPSGGIVTNGSEDARLDRANADALAFAAYIAGLAPTIRLGIIDEADVSVGSVDGQRTLHVVEVDLLKMKQNRIQLTGDPADLFVFNVRGDFTFEESSVDLHGGATAGHVIFNFPTNGNYTRDVKIKKDATVFRGTILAPDLDDNKVVYEDEGSFYGAIIANQIKVHSDFGLRHEPFTGVVCSGPNLTPASFQNYGRGLAGCDGIPALTAATPPVIGQRLRIQQGNAGNTSRTGGLIWGLTPSNFFFPLVGGDFLVGSILLIEPTSVAPGGSNLDYGIAPDCGGIGFEVFMQSVYIDPCGPAGFSLSPGLRLVLGV